MDRNVAGTHETRTAPSPAVPVHAPSSLPTPHTNLSHANEVGNTSPPGELPYCVSNARPPGAVVNSAYEPDPTYDAKYVDPPSYDEAVKGMYYRPPEEPERMRYHHCPDQGQFSTSEPYFYQQTYDNELESELAKSFCSRIIFAIIIFGFVACTIRVLYYVT